PPKKEHWLVNRHPADVINDDLDVIRRKTGFRGMTAQRVFVLERQRNGEDGLELAFADEREQLERSSFAGAHRRDENVGVEADAPCHLGIIGDTSERARRRAEWRSARASHERAWCVPAVCSSV